MSSQPKHNVMQADGTFITFRESMADFAPKAEEFSILRNKIVGIIGKDTSSEFDDTLGFLITLIRNKISIHANTISITTVQKELSGLKNHLTKLQKFMDTGLSGMTQTHLSAEIMKEVSATKREDPFHSLRNSLDSGLRICKATEQKIKGKKPEFTPMHMRQILAEEIARELDRMGIEPKKYREGEFVEILRAVLIAVSCKINGERISISIPNDLFQVARKAIDDYPDKKRYSLLTFS